MSAQANTIQVEVMASAAPRCLQTLRLTLDAGTSVSKAIAQLAQQQGWQAIAAGALAGEWTSAIWSRKASMTEVLRDGDRLELCRALLVDPMVARRERFATQGARGAGLFSKRRAGAKAGY